jgi:hypothetical protein
MAAIGTQTMKGPFKAAGLGHRRRQNPRIGEATRLIKAQLEGPLPGANRTTFARSELYRF